MQTNLRAQQSANSQFFRFSKDKYFTNGRGKLFIIEEMMQDYVFNRESLENSESVTQQLKVFYLMIRKCKILRQNYIYLRYFKIFCLFELDLRGTKCRFWLGFWRVVELTWHREVSLPAVSGKKQFSTKKKSTTFNQQKKVIFFFAIWNVDELTLSICLLSPPKTTHFVNSSFVNSFWNSKVVLYLHHHFQNCYCYLYPMLHQTSNRILHKTLYQILYQTLTLILHLTLYLMIPGYYVINKIASCQTLIADSLDMQSTFSLNSINN